MKKFNKLIILSLICIICGSEVKSQTGEMVKKTFTYSNPADFSYPYFNGRRDIMVKEVRDPVIIREGDTYYLTYNHFPFTHHLDRDPNKPDYNSSPGLRMYKSTDLKNWEYVDWLIKSSELAERSVYKHRFWAPEIHKIKNRFYLIFYADNWIKDEYNVTGRMGYEVFIGVADQITGPYKNFSWLEGGACDTHIFEDEDGKTYAIMPFGGDQYIQELNLDGIDQRKIFLTGTRKKIVSHDYSHLGKVSPSYFEGPWMIKRDGKYILFSAANYEQPDKNPEPGFEYGYWVDAAISDNLFGPYEIYPQILIGGHIGTFIGPDGKDWFSYRGEWRNHPGFTELNIDPVPVNEDGTLYKSYPTNGPQTIEYYTQVGTSGIQTVDRNSNLVVNCINNQLTIHSSSESINSVMIFNLQGQTVYADTDITQTDFTTSVHFSPGIYTAKIQRGNQQVDVVKFLNR